MSIHSWPDFALGMGFGCLAFAIIAGAVERWRMGRVCPGCDGFGQRIWNQKIVPCTYCNGTGRHGNKEN